MGTRVCRSVKVDGRWYGFDVEDERFARATALFERAEQLDREGRRKRAEKANEKAWALLTTLRNEAAAKKTERLDGATEDDHEAE